jgi:FAD/FMN-containing dehydrogenase
VGITGVTLGGGFGLAGRAFGLSADNLIGVDIVTADGRLRHVDQHRDPDLLWALRGGGGGNFGVVTNLHFRVHPLPRSAARFSVAWPWSEASTALDAWQHWAPHTRDQITAVFHLQTGVHAPSVVAAGQYLGPASDLPRLLAPLTSVPGASLSTRDHDYLTLQQIWAGCATQSLASCHTVGAAPHGTLLRANFRAKSDYVNRALPAAARARLVSAIEQRQAIPGGSGAILFDSYGGAINRVAPGATAFVHRSVLFCIQYLTYDAGTSWLRQTYAGVRPYMSGGAYQNYIDSELRTWRHAYYGANYKRLVATQRRVDRHHFFSFPQAIGS